MEIGRKIYYDNLTGIVIVDTGESKGSVVPTTIEQDIEIFSALSERNRESFDVLELAYGQFSQDFSESIGYRVNTETKELEFSYRDPNEPVEPPVFRPPLSLEVEQLRRENNILTAQSKALADQAEFHTDVLTEIILTIAP